MNRLRDSFGKSDEVRHEAIVEAARYAQTLDSSLNITEGIRVAGIILVRLSEHKGRAE
jgi:hypothetical protein